MKFLFILLLFSFSCAKQPEISLSDVNQKGLQASAKKLVSETDQLVVSFDEADVTAHGGDLIHQHLLLSRKVSVPVTVTVSITDSSAYFPQDFTGFVSGNHQSQSIVIAHGTLVGHFPKIAVTKNALCGGKFQLQLSADKNLMVALGSPETIQINCP